MATVKTDQKEVQTPDGEKIIPACEELGVPFACQDGICGTCRSEVLEGMENLNELTEAEKNMGVSGNERLMCQCKIKGGLIKIKF